MLTWYLLDLQPSLVFFHQSILNYVVLVSCYLLPSLKMYIITMLEFSENYFWKIFEKISEKNSENFQKFCENIFSIFKWWLTFHLSVFLVGNIFASKSNCTFSSSCCWIKWLTAWSPTYRFLWISTFSIFISISRFVLILTSLLTVYGKCYVKATCYVTCYVKDKTQNRAWAAARSARRLNSFLSLMVCFSLLISMNATKW